MGKDEVLYLKDKMPDGGNLLEIRGLAGVFVDDEISKGIHEGVAENPQFKIVGSVHGDWDQAKAQAAVAGILPSLPDDHRRGGDAGRRRLRRGAGLCGRRPADAAHHHGQPPGRAAVVEGAEGRQRL